MFVIVTWRTHFTYVVTIFTTIAWLAYARVTLIVLSLLTNTLIQTLIVGTYVTRAQTIIVNRVLH